MIWVWSIVILVSLLIEIMTVGNLVSIWFCIGAVVALVLALFNVSSIIQILVFSVISIIMILSIRPLATNYFRGNITATNADSLIGRRVTLIKSVTSTSWGETKISGVVWNVVSFDGSAIEEGSLVSILAIEGAKLVVRTID